MITMNETYYDYEKTTRRGVMDNEGNVPRLVFGMANGNPRFTAYLGKDKGLAVFPSDHGTIGAMMVALELLVKADNDAKISFNSKAPDRDEEGNALKTMWVKSQIVLGKTKEGMIYLRLEDPKKGTHPFVFSLSDYHDSFENGENMVKAKESVLVMRGWTRLIEGILANGTTDFTRDKYDASDYKPGVIKKYDPNQSKTGGYTKGGYGKPKNQGSQKESSGTDAVSSDFDDDIPF